MSSLRIVLVDPLGEVLFSGESLARSPETAIAPAPRDALATTAPVDAYADSSEAPTDRCPETLRSEGSGVYRAADRASVASALKRVG
ncbi:MAG: hypothetical protein JWP87_2703 [Labilithrix sp.]|nr:hypothetical protein [Labilithrix sp.]